MRVKSLQTRGFSLVELAIVLVILGLLVGGILAGQSLIRASELRAVTAEYTRFKTASAAFKDKYFAIPGDMATATSFWGKSATDCNSHSGTAATPGTCNGNGDGQVDYASGSAEMFRFWQQLALAGLIEGTYTGLASNNSATDDGSYTGNSPSSKFSNALWAVRYASYGSNPKFNLFYGNFLAIGGYYDGTSPPDTKLFLSTELWNMDVKMDDGRPGSGTMVIWRYFDCSTASSITDFDATYILTGSTKCNPIFRSLI